MIETTASLEQTTHVPYEMRTEGPLTYFHYYFEEVDTTIDERAGGVQNPSAKFLPNRYLVGAGVLTATALTGLAVADINKSEVSAKPNVSEPTVQQNSPKAIDAAKRLTPIGTGVQPLQANQPQWSSQLNPSVSKTPTTKVTADATITPRDLKETAPQRVSFDPPNAVDRSSLGSLPRPQRLSPLALPTATGSMSLAQKPEPVITLSQAGLQSKSALPQPLQPAEPQPLSNPQSLAGPALSTDNKGTPGAQVAGISLPEALAPQTSPESMRSQAPAPLPAQFPQPLPSVPAQLMSQGHQRMETLPPLQAEVVQDASKSPLSEKNAARERVEATEAQSVLPKTIQDLLKRSTLLPGGKAVTLVPLTQKAAEEVLAMNKGGIVTDKSERFTILHLNLQDYQQAWLARNKAAQELATEAFPTYGFVDYQNRLIAVLDQTQPMQTSLKVGMLKTDK